MENGRFLFAGFYCTQHDSIFILDRQMRNIKIEQITQIKKFLKFSTFLIIF